MKRLCCLILSVAVVFVAVEAQEVPHSVTTQVSCAVQPTRYDQWYQLTRLSAGEPYVAADKRRQQILDNYHRLKLEMPLEEVERLLGKPDFGTARPALHLSNAPEPTDRRCTNDLAYIVRKNGESIVDTGDVAVYLSFSRDGKLYWVAPQNLPTLKPLGSATGEPPVVESQAVWKEYVFADDGFSITLPDDPHPHKSPQMANGTAYSVPLSNGAHFSLYTEEANDTCTDTVRGQLEDAKKKDESTGYKVISYREIKSSGYKGIEFVQQVPTSKIDYERWICAAHRLYLFIADWNPNESEPKELRPIVDSWRVLADK